MSEACDKSLRGLLILRAFHSTIPLIERTKEEEDACAVMIFLRVVGVVLNVVGWCCAVYREGFRA